MHKKMLFILTFLLLGYDIMPTPEIYPFQSSRVQQALTDKSLLSQFYLEYRYHPREGFPSPKTFPAFGPDGISVEKYWPVDIYFKLYNLNSSYLKAGNTRIYLPKESMVRKVTTILQEFLKIPVEEACVPFESVKSVYGKLWKAKEQDWEDIIISFSVPNTGYNGKVETCSIVFDPETPHRDKAAGERLRRFKELFERETVQFALVTFEKFPRQKVITDPENPKIYYYWETHLTDEDVKKVEREVEARLKAREEKVAGNQPSDKPSGGKHGAGH